MIDGYKDSPLGKIPKNWEVVKSSTVFELIHGYQFRDYDFTEIGLPIAKIGQINKNGEIDMIGCSFFSSDRANEFADKRIFNGDVLMALTGATLGKSCWVAGLENPVYQNYRVGKFVPHDENILSKQFLYFLVGSPLALDQIMSKINSGAQGNVGKSDFEKLKIPLPPLPEQQKIAKILSTVDDKIEVIDQQIAETQALKKGLMQRLLTKGIGHTEFKDSPLGEIPKSWEVLNVGDFANVTAGGTPSTQEPTYWGGNIPWMNSGEINLRRIKSVEGRITDVGLKNSSTKIIQANSVLMALAGQGKTRGKVAINEIPLCTNQSLATIYNFKNASYEYVFQNLESRYTEIRKMSTGDGGRGGLNLAIIKSIKLAFPPLKEQEKIGDLLKLFDNKLTVLEEKKTHYQELKQGLMQQLLTGKIRVTI